MVDVGELQEFVNSQHVALTNATAAETYKQMYNTIVDITSEVTIHQLTNSTLDKLFDIRDFAIEGDIMVTQPEIPTFVALTLQTDNLPPVNSWNISFTDELGNTSTLDSSFRLATLQYRIPDRGDANHHIRLESIDGVVTVT